MLNTLDRKINHEIVCLLGIICSISFPQILTVLQGLIAWHINEAQNKDTHHIEQIDEDDLQSMKEMEKHR